MNVDPPNTQMSDASSENALGGADRDAEDRAPLATIGALAQTLAPPGSVSLPPNRSRLPTRCSGFDNPLHAVESAAGDLPSGTVEPFTSASGYRFPVSVLVSEDCVVPRLGGKTLKAAKKALKPHSCTLGKVQGPDHG
jgi:hypothetical protein